MELNNKTYLRRHLERLPTTQLEELLQVEIHKKEPEEELVRMLLQVLEERHQQDSCELQINSNPAWENYKAGLTERKEQQKKSKRKGLQAVAAIAAVLALVVFVLPQTANANNIVEMIARWSDSFFSFFTQSEIKQEKYVFKTNNQGLQQVYDAVVEMGVRVPVVPMWLEDGYELVEIDKNTTPTKGKVYASLYNGEKTVSLTVTVYYTETNYGMYKDTVEPDKYEISGITHYISHNNDVRTVIWDRENIACTLSVDCREENFYKILESIYTTEAN